MRVEDRPIYHVSRADITGAHVMRSPRLIVLTTNLSREARVGAYRLLDASERRHLTSVVGGRVALMEWLTAPLMRTHEVPPTLRVSDFGVLADVAALRARHLADG